MVGVQEVCTTLLARPISDVQGNGPSPTTEVHSALSGPVTKSYRLFGGFRLEKAVGQNIYSCEMAAHSRCLPSFFLRPISCTVLFYTYRDGACQGKNFKIVKFKLTSTRGARLI